MGLDGDSKEGFKVKVVELKLKNLIEVKWKRGRIWHKEETVCSKHGSWIDEREKTESQNNSKAGAGARLWE